ncbi:MAG: NCS2 family permease [Candidatus Tectomicrobia bacterium]|nr:NCS2 family permease [Candidatus Tectomicrobia bacterium]
MSAGRPPFFVRGDLDGFFGLLIDNLVNLMLIVSLCSGLLGMPPDLVFGRILPGAAASILLGNGFYAWQARRVARRLGREDVTALPYGINTVSLFAFVFFVMLPVYRASGDPFLAWRVGLLACFTSGVVEFLGAFVGGWVRRMTPRAAMLSTLAGIAATFLAADFLFRIFESPLVAMVPLAILLLQYLSRAVLPWRLPAGLWAVLVGTALAWALGGIKTGQGAASGSAGLLLPAVATGDLRAVFTGENLLAYLSITIPMGVMNVLGSLMNIESAEAAGDPFDTRSSLAANGVGSLAAALLGSCFPTTIYIGHPGWKAMGARSGYSALSGGVVALLCLTGTAQWVFRWIPLEAGIGILVWVGVVIVAQAFRAVPDRHAPAVAVGLFPSLAAWGLLLVQGALGLAGTSLAELGGRAFAGSLALRGMIVLERGFLFTAMILSAICVFLVERRFLPASAWALLAAGLSFFGVIHAYEIAPEGVVSVFGFAAAPRVALGYLLMAALFAGMGLWRREEARPVDGEKVPGGSL